MEKRFGIFAAVVIAAALTFIGCSTSDSATAKDASCLKADLINVADGTTSLDAIEQQILHPPPLSHFKLIHTPGLTGR